MTATDLAIGCLLAAITAVPAWAAHTATSVPTPTSVTLPPAVYPSSGEIGEPAWSNVEYATVDQVAVRFP
jgi:hypothetical protein